MADIHKYASDRKQYIEQAKKSFQNYQFQNTKYKKQTDAEEEVPRYTAMKLRIFFSIVIFIAFLFCYQCDYKFYGYSTEKVMNQLEKNYDYTKLKNYVMILQ